MLTWTAHDDSPMTTRSVPTSWAPESRDAERFRNAALGLRALPKVRAQIPSHLQRRVFLGCRAASSPPPRPTPLPPFSSSFPLKRRFRRRQGIFADVFLLIYAFIYLFFFRDALGDAAASAAPFPPAHPRGRCKPPPPFVMQTPRARLRLMRRDSSTSRVWDFLYNCCKLFAKRVEIPSFLVKPVAEVGFSKGGVGGAERRRAAVGSKGKGLWGMSGYGNTPQLIVPQLEVWEIGENVVSAPTISP